MHPHTKKIPTTVARFPGKTRDLLLHITRRIQRKITPRRLFIVCSSVALLLGLTYTVSFYWPRAITFSYATETCFTNPTLLPGLMVTKRSASYTAAPSKIISLGKFLLYSHTTCITATQPPADSTETLLLAARSNTLLQKRIKLTAGTLPSLADEARLDQPVSTQDPLVLQLDRNDRIFTYRLQLDGRTIPCATQNQSVSCDVAPLQLAQSGQYTVALQRLFKGKPIKTLFERNIRTVEAVNITGGSIAADQMVYDIPAAMTLQLNKSATVLKGAKLYLLAGDQRQELPATISLDDKTVHVRFDQPLPRSATLVLTIEHITAPDGGFLPTPYALSFKTSGGPKVLSASIGKTKVQPSSKVVLTFDSDVSVTQAVGNFIRLEIGGQSVAAAVTVRGRTATITPSAALPRCAVFTVRVLDGLQNTYGIAGGSAWQYSSRVICQTVFSIGTSVQGRGITAYSFGNGPSKIIFLGGTHGNEKSSVSIMNRWVEYLENNPDRIPAHRTIVIIPNLNPDGYASGQRTNANNVDLNRNFPTSNWKSGVTMPDRSFNANGGGSQPLSEPESRALANYVLGQSPRLVLTYHASGGVVVPNDSGDSNALAITYAQKSSVGYLSNSGTAGFFEYDTTGAFEDWLHQKHGKAALLIELLTKTNNEFNGHQNALWYIAQLP
jgi:hypothetical protein